MSSRRQLIGALALTVVSLSGCGFRLRGSFEAPFKTMYLQMRENSPLSTAVAQHLRANSNIEIVSSPNEAEAILVLVRESRSRDILSINDSGRAREYELTLSLEFRVSSPEGFDYLETTSISASRDMSYSDTEFLSRAKEENFLYRDMESDLVGQLIRYIEAIKPHQGRAE